MHKHFFFTYRLPIVGIEKVLSQDSRLAAKRSERRWLYRRMIRHRERISGAIRIFTDHRDMLSFANDYGSQDAPTPLRPFSSGHQQETL